MMYDWPQANSELEDVDTATNSRVLRSATKSTPATGVTFRLASRSACWVLALGTQCVDGLLLGDAPPGICLLTTPSNRMSVALPRIFGPTTRRSRSGSPAR
jgi:hypothetical protein